jgi:large subunit ribosomal protein L29
MKENADKARALDAAEINKQLRDGAEQAFRIRFQMSMGQAEGIKKLRTLRTERARMLTILREREIAAVAAPAKVQAKPAKKTAAPVAKPKAVKPKAAAPAKAETKAAAPKKAPAVKKAAAPKAASKAAPKAPSEARDKAKGKG